MDETQNQIKDVNPIPALESIKTLCALDQIDVDVAMDILFRECARLGPELVVQHAYHRVISQMFAVAWAIIQNRTDEATRSWRDVEDPDLQAGIKQFIDFMLRLERGEYRTQGTLQGFHSSSKTEGR